MLKETKSYELNYDFTGMTEKMIRQRQKRIQLKEQFEQWLMPEKLDLNPENTTSASAALGLKRKPQGDGD